MLYTSKGIVRDYPAFKRQLQLYFYLSSSPYKKYGSWVTGHLVEQKNEAVSVGEDFPFQFEITGADSFPSISGSYGIASFRGSEIIRIDA